MRGNKIVLSTSPKGTFEECLISGTPLPGTIMEPVPGVATVGGRLTYRASTQPTGNRRAIAVLMEDYLQGFPSTTAYESGKRGFIYWPAPGEELNLLLQVPGTGTGVGGIVGVGTRLMVGSNGQVLPEVGAPAATPFFSMELLPDILTGTAELVWAKFCGGSQ